MFSSLSNDVPGARVLDLFAGTGAVGLEALSRGAEHAVFVDTDARAVETIKTNLEKTHLPGAATVVRSEVLRFLRGDDRKGAPADLVFLDPPYEDPGLDLDAVLAELASGWLAAEGWAVALTRGIRSSTPVIPVDWALARRLEYGDSLALVFREARWV